MLLTSLSLESLLMLKPIDVSRRDGPLYSGSTKALRDFIDPRHLLLRVDANFDFQALLEFLHDKYDPDIGRPAIHPEIIIRALLLSAIYDVPSYRQLCERIKENLAWRWFCHLALEDPVFDHSTISVFIDRIGSDSFHELLSRLNEGLLRLGLLSPRTYIDSSVVEANVRTPYDGPNSPDPKQIAERAMEKDGVFTVRQKEPSVPEENRLAQLRCVRYQDKECRLRLSPVDPDARWTKLGRQGRAVLGYRDNLIVDKSGFILARSLTPANASESSGIEPLLDRLPLSPTTLCGDTAYRSLRFRHKLRQRGITAYIPLHPNQESDDDSLLSGGFTYHGDHLICRQGKTLKQAGLPNAEGIVFYRALQSDCNVCKNRKSCLTGKRKYKQLGISRYQYELQRARQVNNTLHFKREMRRRMVVVEGVFAHLDRLAWDKARLRGREKVDCQACIAALAHNILKALTKRRFWKRGACEMGLSCQAIDLNSLLSMILCLIRPLTISVVEVP